MVTFNIVSADQYYPLEYAFLDNFIMALTQFTAPSNLCALASIW